MIAVIDASVALRWFLKNESDATADAVLHALVAYPDYFAVPELFAFEVYSVLCRIHPEPDRAYLEGFIPILQSGLFRYPMTESLAREAFRFVRDGLTGYDAVYAALAASLKGLWLTFDSKAHAAIILTGVSHDLGEGLPENIKI